MSIGTHRGKKNTWNVKTLKFWNTPAPERSLAAVWETAGLLLFASAGKDASRNRERTDKKQPSMWCLNGPDLGPPVNCVQKERPKLLPRAAPELVGCESEGGWVGEGRERCLCRGVNSPPASSQLRAEGTHPHKLSSSQGNQRQLQLSPDWLLISSGTEFTASLRLVRPSALSPQGACCTLLLRKKAVALDPLLSPRAGHTPGTFGSWEPWWVLRFPQEGSVRSGVRGARLKKGKSPYQAWARPALKCFKMIFCLKPTHLTDENGESWASEQNVEIKYYISVSKNTSEELVQEKQGSGALARQITRSPGFIAVWTLIGLLRPECDYGQQDMESWKRCFWRGLPLRVGDHHLQRGSEGVRTPQIYGFFSLISYLH